MDNKIDFKKAFLNGIITENPTFVLMLGMCPTLATTTSFMNAVGMGLSTTVVLAFSNLIISLLRHIIPEKVRIPSFIVIVASLVTIVQLLIEAYFNSIYKSLGIYIPLIVVNCIILGRAESFASKNDPLSSLGDGLGMGLGFTIGLCSLGIIRELIGSGSIFGHMVIPEKYHINMFVLAPGAFLVLAFLVAIQNKLKLKNGLKHISMQCDNDCAHCNLHNKEKEES